MREVGLADGRALQGRSRKLRLPPYIHIRKARSSLWGRLQSLPPSAAVAWGLPLPMLSGEPAQGLGVLSTVGTRGLKPDFEVP